MNLYRLLIHHWNHAEPLDYGLLTLAAVISVWFFLNFKLD